uniref:Uncharacterized protein n=2 Tax=Meloidogyne TaxID=189290 RepID=A0A6V7WY48_MELEN|nr:unnamed protein product [Meloidogyne enterolobii]
MVYSPKIMVFVYSVVMYFRNFLCHAIIMERLLATIWVSNYENNRSRWFTYFWVIIDIIITVVTAYFFSNSTDVETLLVNVVSQSVMSTFGVIEIFILLRLLRHNEKIYFERSSLALSAHKLTGRYQLCENIRTTKQLLPTLCLHVCINIIAGSPLALAYFKLVTSQFGIILCVSFLMYLPITYLCFFIELSMIL